MTRVLVIKPSSLGDVIHGLPAVRVLRSLLGTELERLTWVVNDSFSGLLEMAPDVDRIVRFPRKRIWERGVMGAFKRELQSESYDVAIDFQGLLRSGLMSWFSKAPRRIGFADGRELSPWFYTEKVKVPRGHAVEKNLLLVRKAFGPAGNDETSPGYPAGALLTVTAEELDRARALLGVQEGVPVLAVGHSSRWPSKNWPTDFFGRVLDSVSAQVPGLRIWLLGAPEESAHAEAVTAACTAVQPLNLCGKSDMKGLVGLLSASDALLTNDSGPMHLAAAVDIPVVALFGATDPGLTGPYGVPGRHTVFRSTCDRSPCFQHVCPLGEGACAKGTSVEDVAAAVVSALRKGRE